VEEEGNPGWELIRLIEEQPTHDLPAVARSCDQPDSAPTSLPLGRECHCGTRRPLRPV